MVPTGGDMAFAKGAMALDERDMPLYRRDMAFNGGDMAPYRRDIPLNAGDMTLTRRDMALNERDMAHAQGETVPVPLAQLGQPQAEAGQHGFAAQFVVEALHDFRLGLAGAVEVGGFGFGHQQPS